MTKFSYSLLALALLSSSAANAYEFGGPGGSVYPGILLGNSSAGGAPPGGYMVNQATGWQASIVGARAPKGGGGATPPRFGYAGSRVFFVSGWTFLGATYDA